MLTWLQMAMQRRGRDESAEAALGQIRERGYAEPYRADGRPVWAIGFNFDLKTRNLTDALYERLA